MPEAPRGRRAVAWLAVLGLVAAACGRGQRASGPEELRRALQVPRFRNPLAPTVLRSWQDQGLVFEQVRFQGRFEEWIPALLCYPAPGRARPLPAVLCMPGSPNRKEDLLEPMDLLPRLADRGFVVLSIDRPYHGQRAGDLAAAIREKGLARVWGEYVYDLMRALDYLETRPEADRRRLGMLGLSMGGMEALMLADLDPRVRVVVSVAGQVTWEEVFRTDAWRLILGGLDLGQRLQREGASGAEAWRRYRKSYPEMPLVDARELAPRLAPRPLLMMTGGEDPYITRAAATRVYEAARPAYEAAAADDRLGLWVEDGVGHAFTAAMQGRALEWFGRWL